MKWVNHLGVLFLLIFISGCASNQWQTENIPYPRTTPFDSSQFARAAYLDGFERGYRSEISGGGGTSVEMLAGPHTQARRQGFYAGAAQGRADRPQGVKSQQ